ncbi:hypothetical protein SDC9_194171 [bioreactor metagenome]|uniref:Uncharacterized protein n=1 Tax=bioreactor metagenome TaxID=1076179 RepID=A0A645I644_9ZZZZ
MRSVGIPQNEHFGRATRKRDVSNPSAGFTAITCLGSQISIRMQTVTRLVLMQIFCGLWPSPKGWRVTAPLARELGVAGIR